MVLTCDISTDILPIRLECLALAQMSTEVVETDVPP